QEPVSPHSLNAAIPIDLETVCLRCLEKSTRRRYGTAGELVAELERFLDGRPVRARPVGRLGQVVRWYRRNRLGGGLSAVTILALLLGTVFSISYAVQADRNAQDALDAKRLADGKAKEAAENARQAQENAREALDAKHLADIKAKEATESARLAQDAK